MRPLGDTFVKLVKMVIGPIIFLTIVLGIARVADVKKIGRVGGKAFLYFEIVTTFALAIGLTVVNVAKPGAGLDANALPKGDVSQYAAQGQSMKFADFITHIVPSSPVDAFAQGDILQIVFFAILFGFAVVTLGSKARAAHGRARDDARRFLPHRRLHHAGRADRRVRRDGVHDRHVRRCRRCCRSGRLMIDVYLTMFLFIFVVLNLILRWYGFSLWAYLKYIREEILIVVGTSSSEAALPGLMTKLERYGCAKPVVGLVVPTGYSFNLDGTSIYLSMATLFLAQVYGVPLTHRPADRDPRGTDDHVEGGRRRDGLRIHRAREHAVGDEGRADRGNCAAARRRPVHEPGAGDHELIGNGVATLVISRSENEFDEKKRASAIVEIAEARACCSSLKLFLDLFSSRSSNPPPPPPVPLERSTCSSCFCVCPLTVIETR